MRKLLLCWERVFKETKPEAIPLTVMKLQTFMARKLDYVLLGSLGFAVVVKVLVVAKIISLPPKQDLKN